MLGFGMRRKSNKMKRKRMSHVGTHMTVLCSDSGWTPPFCQNMELKSERYNLDLEPNTNFRGI